MVYRTPGTDRPLRRKLRGHTPPHPQHLPPGPSPGDCTGVHTHITSTCHLAPHLETARVRTPTSQTPATGTLTWKLHTRAHPHSQHQASGSSFCRMGLPSPCSLFLPGTDEETKETAAPGR